MALPFLLPASQAIRPGQLDGMPARPLFSCQKKKGCGMMYKYFKSIF